jgi:hypothetical protein
VFRVVIFFLYSIQMLSSSFSLSLSFSRPLNPRVASALSATRANDQKYQRFGLLLVSTSVSSIAHSALPHRYLLNRYVRSCQPSSACLVTPTTFYSNSSLFLAAAFFAPSITCTSPLPPVDVFMNGCCEKPRKEGDE